MAVIFIRPVVRARMLSSEGRIRLRQLQYRPILDKLRDYLLARSSTSNRPAEISAFA
jgi:hypothetical protein